MCDFLNARTAAGHSCNRAAVVSHTIRTLPLSSTKCPQYKPTTVPAGMKVLAKMPLPAGVPDSLLSRSRSHLILEKLSIAYRIGELLKHTRARTHACKQRVRSHRMPMAVNTLMFRRFRSWGWWCWCVGLILRITKELQTCLLPLGDRRCRSFWRTCRLFDSWMWWSWWRHILFSRSAACSNWRC